MSKDRQFRCIVFIFQVTKSFNTFLFTIATTSHFSFSKLAPSEGSSLEQVFYEASDGVAF